MNFGVRAAGFPFKNRAALALIFGMHMLALLGWLQERQQRFPPPEAPRVVSVLLRPHRVPVRRPARPAAPPPSPSVPARPATARPPAVPASSETVPSPAPVPEPGFPTAPDASSLENTRTPVDVEQAIRDQKEAEGGFALGLSKRQAGRIDRELRKGRSGVPDQPDTPMGRFRRGLEAAHIDRSMSVQEDSYTSPDGVIIYRKRIGNVTSCRRSGSIDPLGMRGMLFANEAGEVPCPKGVQWKKD